MDKVKSDMGIIGEMMIYKLAFFLNILIAANFSFANTLSTEKLDEIEYDRDLRYKAATTTPSKKQLKYIRSEYTAFFHFSPNNYTGRQWGVGDEDPNIFNPTEIDTDQWLRVAKDAGMKTFILTTKHHDGFCLWPSKYTKHSVASSKWRKGKGDIVKMASESARKFGLDFGVYYSISDGNFGGYGKKDGGYEEYVINQLTELYTNYGNITQVWFDGATPPWIAKKHEEGWTTDKAFKGAIEITNKLIPNAIHKEDIALVGSEKGLVPQATSYLFPKGEQDFSFKALEAVTSIRDLWFPIKYSTFWFYHPMTSIFLRNKFNLRKLYYKTVGRGVVLNLNFSPNKKGLIPRPDVKQSKKLGDMIRNTFSRNYIKGASIQVTNIKGEKFRPEFMLDGKLDTYWRTDDWQEVASIIIELPMKRKFDLIVLQEPIQIGQRIQEYEIRYWNSRRWKKIAKGSTVGHKRIIKVRKRKYQKIKINIKSAFFSPAINEIGFYKQSF